MASEELFKSARRALDAVPTDGLGGTYTNVMTGVGKDNVVIDLQSKFAVTRTMLRCLLHCFAARLEPRLIASHAFGVGLIDYSFRGISKTAACGQPLVLLHDVEYFLLSLVRLRATARLLSTGGNDTFTSKTAHTDFLRTVVRAHLLLSVADGLVPVSVDDFAHSTVANFPTASDGAEYRIGIPETPVQALFPDIPGAPATGLQAYIKACQPSSFLLDADEGRLSRALGRLSAALPHVGHGGLGHQERGEAEDGEQSHDNDNEKSLASDVLYTALHAHRVLCMYRILTDVRLPVILATGNSTLNKVKFESRKVEALVAWPFAGPRDARAPAEAVDGDGAATGASLTPTPRPIPSVRADVNEAAVALGEQLRALTYEQSVFNTSEMQREAVDALLQSVTLLGPELCGRGGWGLLMGVAAGLLLAQHMGAADKTRCAGAVESYFLHVLALPMLPMQHRVFSDEVLAALRPAASAGHAEQAVQDMLMGLGQGEDAYGIYAYQNVALRSIMATLQSSGATVHSQPPVGPLQSSPVSAETLPSFLGRLPHNTLADSLDVRLWTLMHGLCSAGRQEPALLHCLFHGEQTLLAALTSLSTATGMRLPSLAVVAQGQGPAGSPGGVMAALKATQARTALALVAATTPPSVPCLPRQAGSFLHVLLGPATAHLECIQGTGEKGAEEEREAINAFYSDRFHAHSLRRLRVSRKPRELRSQDSVYLSGKAADLHSSSDISSSQPTVGLDKWAMKKLQKNAANAQTVSTGMQGGVIERHKITLLGSEDGESGPGVQAEKGVNAMVMAFKQEMAKVAERADEAIKFLKTVSDSAPKSSDARVLWEHYAGRYAQDTLESVCQHLPPSKTDHRCMTQYPKKPSVSAELLFLVDIAEGRKSSGGATGSHHSERKVDKKTAAAYVKEIREALDGTDKRAGAVKAWEQWKEKDAAFELEQLGRLLRVHSSTLAKQGTAGTAGTGTGTGGLPAGGGQGRRESDISAMELFQAADGVLQRYWPSAYDYLHGPSVTSDNLSSFLSTAQGIVSSASPLPACTGAAAAQGDVLLAKESAKEDVKTILTSAMLPALLITPATRRVAAALSLYLLSTLASWDGQASSKKSSGLAARAWAGGSSWKGLSALWTELVPDSPSPFPSFVEWQLQCTPEYLLRPRGKDDRRVRNFRPDDWQVRLLDHIDHNQSALVCIPTSGGKTMLSFYAMERVLRQDDAGVIVYVAPTKALCDQVAAEVAARFDKEYAHSSRALVGLFVADKRYDEQRCQILVCIPQTLEILLLSAAQEGWASSVRRIIFDEVHNVVSDNGEVWERLLLYSPGKRPEGADFGDCAILALSATIGDFRAFKAWLGKVETSRGKTLQCIGGPGEDEKYGIISRWNDLSISTYAPSTATGDTTAGTSRGGTNLVTVHPLASIDISRLGSGKPYFDLHLIPEESVQLWYALECATRPWGTPAGLGPLADGKGRSAVIRRKIMDLRADAHFPVAARVYMSAAHAWGRSLLSCLHEVADESREVGLEVLRVLSVHSTQELMNVDASLHEVGQMSYLMHHLPKLVTYLQSSKQLPAIVFHMNKRGCGPLGNAIAGHLLAAEQEYRESEEFQEKVRALKRSIKELESAISVLETAVKAAKPRPGKAGQGAAGEDGRAESGGADDPALELQRLQDKKEEKQATLNELTDGAKPIAARFTLFSDSSGPAPPSTRDIDDIARLRGGGTVYDLVKEEVAKYKEEQLRQGRARPITTALKWALLLRGIALHNSSMQAEYKRAVEFMFRQGKLRLCLATSTLSQGINMPCKTVVLAGDSTYLDALNYRQMIGRAGRRGFDLRGAVVLLGIPSARAMQLTTAVLPGMAPAAALTASQVLRLAVKYDVTLRPALYMEGDKGDLAAASARGAPPGAAAGEAKGKASGVSALAAVAESWDDEPAAAAAAPPTLGGGEGGWDDEEEDDTPAAPPSAAMAGAADDTSSVHSSASEDSSTSYDDDAEDEAGGPDACPMSQAAAMLGDSDGVSITTGMTGRQADVRVGNRSRAEVIRKTRLKDAAGGIHRIASLTMQLHMQSEVASRAAVDIHFFLEHLHRQGLLNRAQRPLPLAGLPVHLHYVEPSNMMLCHLLRTNTLSRMLLALMKPGERDRAAPLHWTQSQGCHIRSIDQSTPTATIWRDMGLLHLLVFLFRRDPPSTRGDAGVRERTVIYPKSMPASVRVAMRRYKQKTLDSYNAHLKAFVLHATDPARVQRCPLPDPATLPLSGQSVRGSTGLRGLPERGDGQGVRGLLGSVAQPMILRSPVLAMRGNCDDSFSSLYDASEGLRPGLCTDPSSLPLVDTEMPVSRWLVDIYQHGQMGRVTDLYGVDDGDQYFALAEFMRCLKAIANSITLRWWSLYTTFMQQPVPDAPVWQKAGERWRDPISFDADLLYIAHDLSMREGECGVQGLQGKAHRQYRRMRDMLMTELPVVQAFRGLAVRYGKVGLLAQGAKPWKARPPAWSASGAAGSASASEVDEGLARIRKADLYVFGADPIAVASGKKGGDASSGETDPAVLSGMPAESRGASGQPWARFCAALAHTMPSQEEREEAQKGFVLPMAPDVSLL